MWTEGTLAQGGNMSLPTRSHAINMNPARAGPFSAPMRTPRSMRVAPTPTPRMYLPPPPIAVTKPSPDLLSAENLKLVVRRLRRPTYVSRVKSFPSRKDWYVEKDSVLWNRIPLFADHKLTMWTPLGTVRRSCRI